MQVTEKAMSQTELQDLESEIQLLDKKATEANSSLSRLNNLTKAEVEQQMRVQNGLTGPNGIPPRERFKVRTAIHEASIRSPCLTSPSWPPCPDSVYLWAVDDGQREREFQTSSKCKTLFRWRSAIVNSVNPDLICP